MASSVLVVHGARTHDYLLQLSWWQTGSCWLQMMRVDVTKYNKRFGIVKLNAKAYVGPDIVCEAELTLAMGS